MSKNQNHRCGICKKRKDIKKAFAVDHDHSTGDIRGLLCYKCNVGLGYFNDKIKLLQNAIKYLNDN